MFNIIRERTIYSGSKETTYEVMSRHKTFEEAARANVELHIDSMKQSGSWDEFDTVDLFLDMFNPSPLASIYGEFADEYRIVPDDDEILKLCSTCGCLSSEELEDKEGKKVHSERFCAKHNIDIDGSREVAAECCCEYHMRKFKRERMGL